MFGKSVNDIQIENTAAVDWRWQAANTNTHNTIGLWYSKQKLNEKQRKEKQNKQEKTLTAAAPKL